MDTTGDITQAASAMGKKGGKRGGPARAAAMTAEERKESARHAALKRWHGTPGSTILQATHGSTDRPLRIGDVEIPCYVVENGQRVILLKGMLTALGLGRGGIANLKDSKGYRLVSLVHGKSLNPFISKKLYDGITQPLNIRIPEGYAALGYDATLLADLCEAVLEARDAGALRPIQAALVAQCDLLMRSFARVGIIALVDEATGYQEFRDRDELHKILAAYISPTLMPWTQRFPEEFYVEICRLKHWTYNRTYKGPRRIAQLTKQLVYDQLPPGVLDELHRLNPPLYKGYSRKHRHHQLLTETIGHPHLDKHLLLLVTILRVAETWDQFETFFAQTFPTPTAPLALPEPAPDVIDVTPEPVEV